MRCNNSGVQLPAYHWFKQQFQNRGVDATNPIVHAVSSFGSAGLSTMTINPLDVIRTRLYNQPFDAQGSGLWYVFHPPSSSHVCTRSRLSQGCLLIGSARYKNGVDAAVKVMRAEGPLAFYKGALTHFMRLGPHLVLVFTFHEQFKRILV